MHQWNSLLNCAALTEFMFSMQSCRNHHREWWFLELNIQAYRWWLMRGVFQSGIPRSLYGVNALLVAFLTTVILLSSSSNTEICNLFTCSNIRNARMDVLSTWALCWSLEAKNAQILRNHIIQAHFSEAICASSGLNCLLMVHLGYLMRNFLINLLSTYLYLFTTCGAEKPHSRRIMSAYWVCW